MAKKGNTNATEGKKKAEAGPQKIKAEAGPQKIKGTLCPKKFGMPDPRCYGPKCKWFIQEKDGKYSDCVYPKVAHFLNSISYTLRSGSSSGSTDIADTDFADVE
jgi:hypothetical protein